MSPKMYRRTAIQSAGAAAVTLALWEGGAQTAKAAVAPIRPSNHGLPPNSRLVLVGCAECGVALGEMRVDEFDVPNKFVCSGCYKEKVGEAEEANSDADALEDLEIERDDLQQELDVRNQDLKHLLKLVDRLDDELTVFPGLSEWKLTERMSDLLADIHVAVAKVTRPA